MKRSKSWLLCVICFVSFMLTFFLPAKNIDVARAQNDITQTLISTNLTSDELQSVYGAGETSSLSSFTPFDYELGTRMTGKSITPNANSNATFDTVRFDLLENGGLNATEDNLAFGIWLYFSNTLVHSLEIKIAVDDNNFYRVQISRTDLTNILKKTEGVTEPGFAWNYIEFPIIDTYITGSIVDENGCLKSFGYMEIKYNHSTIDEDTTYSRLRMFGLEIVTTSNHSVTATIKQDYYIFSFNFWNQDVLTSLVQGDYLTVPNLSGAVDYAWVGELNLLEAVVDWRIELVSPSGSEKTYTFSSNGDGILLEESGEYEVIFRAYKDNGATIIDLYEVKRFYVLSNNLVYFSFSSYQTEVGAEKIITLNVSELLDTESLEILSVSAPSETVEIFEAENPYEYKVKGVSEGTAKISIKILAKRNTNNSSDFKEYIATTTIEVNKVSTTNSVLMIIVISLLGVIIIVSSIIGIKSLVKSRKNGVK